METEEREDEDEEDDDDQNWPLTAAHSRGKRNSNDDSSVGEELNQTHTKKNTKKSSKRKRDDTAEVSREFTFINHLGAYTGQFILSFFLHIQHFTYSLVLLSELE